MLGFPPMFGKVLASFKTWYKYMSQLETVIFKL